MARPEHRYHAFGLRIHAELELPELAPAADDGAAPDLVVRLGEVGELPGGDGEWVRWVVEPGEALGFLEGVCRLAVRAGGEIVVEPLEEPATAHVYVVGPGLALALAQRGAHVLHASAVAVEGRAVAFAADRGQGKSTMAAALHARGHRLVADDVTPVRLVDGAATVVPGYPQQKLWPESAGALGLGADALPRVYPEIDKRVRRLAGDFDTTPLPLAAVVVLDRGEPVAIEPLSGSAAAVELVRHSYDILATRRFSAADNLEAAAGLAAAVPVLRLRRPWRLDGLDQAADAVVAAVGSGTEVTA